MTEKLYESQPQQLRFTSTVQSCVPTEKGYAVVLDATAFFPEGGGQPWDTGTLGGVPVVEVHTDGETITHTLTAPLAVGSAVEGQVDAARRLDHSQQHTGEHILSGTLHRLYGADNVGFHIGDPYVRMDMSVPLTGEQLAEAERQANAVIWQNVPVHAWFPGKEELSSIPYRSKKELQGDVRLVEISGADCCACCGTHLPSSGGVGMIKIVSAQSYKGGTRLAVACGGRALSLVQQEHDQIVSLSGLLSAKPEEVLPAAVRMKDELMQQRTEKTALFRRYLEAETARTHAGQQVIRLMEGLDADGVRQLCLAVSGASGALCALFAPTAAGLTYAICWPGKDVRPLAKGMNTTCGGRGGGRDALCQGSLPEGCYPTAKHYLEENCHENAI